MVDMYTVVQTIEPTVSRAGYFGVIHYTNPPVRRYAFGDVGDTHEPLSGRRTICVILLQVATLKPRVPVLLMRATE